MKMSNEDAIAEMRSGSRFNRARGVFRSGAARIEQDGQQRRPSSPIDVLRMEFDIVREIVEALGLEIPEDAKAGAPEA